MAMDEKHVEVVEHLICRTSDELLQSPAFRRVLLRFLRSLERRSSPLLAVMDPFRFPGAGAAEGQRETGGAYAGEGPGEETAVRSDGRLVVTATSGVPYDLDGFIQLLQLLVHKRAEDIRMAVPAFARRLPDTAVFHDFVEELYDFWRKHERFLILEANPRQANAEQHRQFIQLNEEFKAVVLETYRKISANLTGRLPQVYRQLPCGAGVGFLVGPAEWVVPGEHYRKLASIPFIQTTVIEPPLVYYPKRNFRRGSFEPLSANPLPRVRIEPSQWLCYPAWVGDLSIFIFFHKRYMALAASLSNLFELAAPGQVEGRKPDGILLFGVDPEVLPDNPTMYYEDPDTGVVVGLVARSDEVDYFGYFKKMTLTLHNVICIERGYLPVHGAMARILLRAGGEANVILVGDSGAGKSESLEAFRVLAGEYLRQLTVVFDDMGSLRLRPPAENGPASGRAGGSAGGETGGRVIAVGTEIGAFVRLDDLEPGFGYAEIDRSIFMNPHKTNARLVIPITRYDQVVEGVPVDMYLYANNYEPVDEEHPYLEAFTDVERALKVFSAGARMSKGTTDEEGLTHTYFANPFGAPQKREKHHVLARQYLERMLATGVVVGQLRTQLGVPGYGLRGPEAAARALFEFITRRAGATEPARR